jgi:phosphopantothenoylcysteine decarboxylase/phosphopantothenate--cysteine ligase
VNNKRILLAVTGSIAAYKAVFLLRLFRKAGAEVKVLMTSAAKDFVSPLTFSVLSESKVDSDISDGEQWNNHVDSGLWADVMVIAPCTTNTLAKMAHGLADNVVLATYLSARCPVVVSPAMDVDMYHHPSTQNNLKILETYGVQIIPVDHGELASGLIGEGRMAEPEAIFEFIRNVLEQSSNNSFDLTNKTVLITAGPTQEAIDPVRYIGNRSSGKMGIALAKECAKRGAHVYLILGPTHLACEGDGINLVRVNTAAEMLLAADQYFEQSDVAIMAAAVADYKPVTAADKKIKKSDDEPMTLTLIETQDIAATLGKKKQEHQILVGFALETHDGVQYAKGKLEKKNFDFIVLNSLGQAGVGFAHDTNKVSIIRRNGKSTDYPLKLKTDVAKDIVNEICELFNKK